MPQTFERPVVAEVRLRAKNQLTLPSRIAAALGAQPDDVLGFEMDPSQPGVAHVQVRRSTYAGALTGIYGTTEDVKTYLRGEHVAWPE